MLERKLKDMPAEELAMRFAKSLIAYDELETIGKAFFGKLDPDAPSYSSRSIYGNGMAGDELLNLAKRYRNGLNPDTDEKFCFARDFVFAICGIKGACSMSFEGGVLTLVHIKYEVVDSLYLLNCEDFYRILTYEQIFDSFLSLARDEYERCYPEELLPNVKVLWSESIIFEDNTFYSVKDFDSIMKQADLGRHAKQKEMLKKYGTFDAWRASGERTDFICYEKTKFIINFKDGESITERQDIGDGIGGLVEFMEALGFSEERLQEIREAAGRSGTPATATER